METKKNIQSVVCSRNTRKLCSQYNFALHTEKGPWHRKTLYARLNTPSLLTDCQCICASRASIQAILIANESAHRHNTSRITVARAGIHIPPVRERGCRSLGPHRYCTGGAEGKHRSEQYSTGTPARRQPSFPWASGTSGRPVGQASDAQPPSRGTIFPGRGGGYRRLCDLAREGASRSVLCSE